MFKTWGKPMMSGSGCKIAKFAYYDARHKVAGYFANSKIAEVETRKKYELPFLPCIDTRQHILILEPLILILHNHI